MSQHTATQGFAQPHLYCEYSSFIGTQFSTDSVDIPSRINDFDTPSTHSNVTTPSSSQATQMKSSWTYIPRFAKTGQTTSIHEPAWHNVNAVANLHGHGSQASSPKISMDVNKSNHNHSMQVHQGSDRANGMARLA